MRRVDGERRGRERTEEEEEGEAKIQYIARHFHSTIFSQTSHFL